MPKAKRTKTVPLTNTVPKGDELKRKLVEAVRVACDDFAYVYVFAYAGMRTAKFKKVRQEFKGSRFFLGKNRVMRVALGRGASSEYKQGLAQLGERLVGNVGLLMTNRAPADAAAALGACTSHDFARSGVVATSTIVHPAGALEGVPSSMVDQLRRCGLPVTLKNGVVHVDCDYTVCTEGDTLTPEQCQLLKQFDHQLARFEVRLAHVWHDDKCVALGGD
jgi:mRNA turnover protein 4